MNAVLQFRLSPLLSMISGESEAGAERITTSNGRFALLACYKLRAMTLVGKHDLPLLRSLLADSQPRVRRAAYRTLSWYGANGKELLLEMLSHAVNTRRNITGDELTELLRTTIRLRNVAGAEACRFLVELIPRFTGSSDYSPDSEYSYERCLSALSTHLLPYLPRMLEILTTVSLAPYRSTQFFLAPLYKVDSTAPEQVVRMLIPHLQAENTLLRVAALKLLLCPVRRIRHHHELKKGQVTVTLSELRSELNLMVFAERDESVLAVLRQVVREVEG